MTTLATKLTAIVSYERTIGKLNTVTHVTIKAGPLVIGTGTFGGRYSQNQALREFKVNTNRFKLTENYVPAFRQLAA
jgi:hypothetical protein